MFLLCFSIGGIFKRHRCTRDRYDSNHGRLFSSLSFSFSQSFLASRLFNPSFSFTLLTLLRQRISVHRLVAFSLSRENSLSAAKQRDPPDEIWIHVPPFIFHARLPSILLARVPCLPRRSATTVCVGCTAISQASLLSFFFPSPSRSRPIFSRYIRVWSCCSDVVVVVFVVFSVVFVAAAIVVSSSSSSLGRRRVFVLLRTIDAYIPTTSKYVHAFTYTMVCKRTYTRMTYWNIYVLVQNVVSYGRREKDTGNRTVQCLPYM